MMPVYVGSTNQSLFNWPPELHTPLCGECVILRLISISSYLVILEPALPMVVLCLLVIFVILQSIMVSDHCISFVGCYLLHQLIFYLVSSQTLKYHTLLAFNLLSFVESIAILQMVCKHDLGYHILVVICLKFPPSFELYQLGPGDRKSAYLICLSSIMVLVCRSLRGMTLFQL